MVGALDEYKIDFGMLLEVAREREEWQFVFVGKPVVDHKSGLLKKLSKLKNVHLLGQVDRQRVPQYVYNFDVCVIPYRANKYNAASFPLKFWEFMATGKPVVVTGLPELKMYQAMIGYAKNKKEFITKIEQALRERPGTARERKLEAGKHSWERRAGAIIKVLKKEL